MSIGRHWAAFFISIFTKWEAALITDLMPPDSEPVTLEAAKLFLRIDHDDENSLINDLIRSAREQIETLCSQTLIQRQQQAIWTQPFSSCLRFPTNPIQAVSNVVVYFPDGQEQSITDFDVNLRATPATLGFDIPKGVSTIVATIHAGYGATAEDIPMPLRQAILLLIGQGYEQRNGNDLQTIPMMVDALIMPYRSLKL